jgi:DNA-binding MarR family transcriptional regulator
MASEIDDIHSKIMDFIARKPALTVDIAEHIGRDSDQTSAILDYFVAKKELQRSDRRYGTSAIYYLEKNRDAAMEMLYNILSTEEKALVSKIKATKVINSATLTPAERYISKSLTDFIKTISAQDSETKQKIDLLYYYTLSLEDVSAFLNQSKKPEKINQKTAIARESKKLNEETRLKVAEPLTPEIKNMLLNYGFSGAMRIEPDIYYCDYGQNKLRVVVIVSKKISITKKDLIKFAGYATAYKTVIFVLTTARKIIDYSGYGNSINFIKMT